MTPEERVDQLAEGFDTTFQFQESHGSTLMRKEIVRHINEAVAEEREACALEADQVHQFAETFKCNADPRSLVLAMGRQDAACAIGVAIRARGEERKAGPMMDELIEKIKQAEENPHPIARIERALFKFVPLLKMVDWIDLKLQVGLLMVRFEKEEREACAKLAEAEIADWQHGGEEGLPHMAALSLLIAKIRARGR